MTTLKGEELRKWIKENSVRVLRFYWEEKIGTDHDHGPSTPEWIEIRKIIRSIMEYDQPRNNSYDQPINQFFDFGSGNETVKHDWGEFA